MNSAQTQLNRAADEISRTWICETADFEAINKLAQRLNISPLITHILRCKGYETVEQAQNFFRASLQDMPDPVELADCDRAAQRILTAILNKEKICIYGDYDVDGITSSALIFRFIQDCFDQTVNVYIPQRLIEGYGLNKEAIDTIHQQGTQVLITVDNGSSAYDEIQHAENLGMDCIIIDHHQVSNPEPPAYAHLNPHRPSSTYPDRNLAAVGVAFLCLVQMRRHIRTHPDLQSLMLPSLESYLDIVALGTVADVARLTGLNRAMVKVGLKHMTAHPRAGIQALADISRYSLKPASATMIGYGIGPRLNAAGRLDDARYGLHLLISDDEHKVRELAERVEIYNRERQSIQKKIEQEAMQQALEYTSDPIIIVADRSWHHGVVGIVASRLVDRFHRPAIVLGGHDEGILKGSGRSVSGINLKSTLDSSADYLLTYGGHVAAAGLSIKEEDLTKLRTDLSAHLLKQGQSFQGLPDLKAVAEVQLSDITAGFMDDFEKLAPFGHGNATPKFISRSIRARAVTLKNGAHLKLHFNLPKHMPQSAIGWNMGECIEFCDQSFDLCFIPEWNEFRGNKSIVLKIKGIRPSVV
jgi:single-stranded-DNA-specific exonuclease